MSKYFNYFPKLVYYQGNYTKVVTDIMTRVSAVASYANNTLLFYDYSIQDGDTPETIAYKYYGDVEKHWIILLTNNIQDPFYDWPLNYERFSAYVNDKYSANANTANGQTGMSYALSTIDHYEMVITTTDLVTGNVTMNNYVIDQNTYTNFIPQTYNTSICTISRSAEPVTIYDNENNINEAKRNIKILNKDYSAEIFNELESTLGS